VSEAWQAKLDGNIFMVGLGSPLIRLVRSPANGPPSELPNVFTLSESLLKDNSDSQPFSANGKNLLFVYFGIFVLNEILDSRRHSCPPSYSKIYFPRHYLDKSGKKVEYFPTTNHTFMMLNKLEHCKSVHGDINNPLTKANFRTVWIDGETVYGNSKFCADHMRTFENGRLIDLHILYSLKRTNLHCFNRKFLYH